MTANPTDGAPVFFQYAGTAPEMGRPGNIYIVGDNWDDFTYKTTFHLYVADENGIVRELGSAKIGRFGIGDNGGKTVLPPSFTELASDYFSLGQDADYYEKLNQLGPKVRDVFLGAMRDIAADEGLYQIALQEPVTQYSLLRSVDSVTVEGQFRRLIRGEARVVGYDFVFQKAELRNEAGTRGIEFSVSPNANPPTNIHALIGSNGSGKTRILDEMGRALAGGPVIPDSFGYLSHQGDGAAFAGLVTVSFSAFDRTGPAFWGALPRTSNGVRTQSIGLHSRAEGGSTPSIKSAEDLDEEFVESLRRCAAAGRVNRWMETVSFLQTDPLLSEMDLRTFVDSEGGSTQARETFHQLSSGHKIVLLTITRLVELVQERTLVLMDEPETHLHPPLLSAFVHALSHLLVETNGVAVAATHSPVVLQEVPQSCVWILNRSGDHIVARRPSLETFAENVGELTHEVFSLEVTESGYHARLQRAANEATDYEALLRHFGGKLGREGRAIARSLISKFREDR